MIIIQIFELMGTILLKDTGVENQLNSIEKKAKGTGNVFNDVFGKIGSAVLKVGAILGVGMGIESMVSAASKAQSSLAQMSAVLKSTGDASGMTQQQLVSLAGAQSQLSLQSKSSNMDTENLLLTFTNLGKNVFPQCLTTVNDMSQALGQDTKSSAIQLGKALQDPIKGVTALARVGVNFTSQQKEQIKTLVESGHTLEAQKIILTELGKEFRGSALSASKTFGGQMTILKNNLTGLGGSIANVVLPYFTRFATWVNGNMPKIQSVFIGAINYIIPKLQEFAKFISDKIVPVISTMATTISTNMPKIRQFIVDMVDIVVPKFQKIIDVCGQIYKEIFPNTKQSSADLSGAIKSLTTTALNILIVAFEWVRDNLPIVTAVVAALTAKWIIQTGITLANNIAMLAYNVQMGIKGGLDLLDTGYIIALYAAQGISTAATWLGVTATAAFNLVMSLNPIAIVVIALAALGLAVAEVVTHWQDICTWVEKAWDWLTKWNGTPAVNKDATMTTHNVTVTANPKHVGANAAGTDFWEGGLTHINEAGGEIIDLPEGTRIIPHDISLEMAKNKKDNESKGNVYHFNIDH